MNLLFVHDHKFRKVGNTFYSTGGLNDEVLSRYTVFVKHMTIIARVIEVDSANGKWSKITNDKVDILGTASFYFSKICDEIKKCDKLIVRMPSVLGVIALKANERIKKPCLIEMVACPWDSFWNHSIKGKIIAPFAYYLTKKYVKKASYVIYVTSEFLQQRYPTLGKSIGCSDVVLDSVDNMVLSQRLSKIDNNDMQEILIGTVAAVDVKYKGQQYVIEALCNLKKKGITNFKYLLVGNGSQSYLKGLITKYQLENQVQLLGGMPHNKIFSWLDSIDLYVQPSRQEGLPRALVEALSRGLPSFGAKTGGIPELLEDDYIFSNTCNNIKEISDILIGFDRKKMREQAQRNFRLAKQYENEKLNIKRMCFMKEFFYT